MSDDRLAWKKRGPGWRARAGHLYLYVRNWGEGHPRNDEPVLFHWYVMIDDDDKCHERCIDESFAGNMDIAKQDCETAARRAAEAILQAFK